MTEDGTSTEFLIESLFILESISGICLFEENYADITKDGMSTDLISSFLSAILSFAGEAFTDEIQYIKFSNRKIIFEFTQHILFVIAVNDETPANKAQIKRLIDNITKSFKNRYSKVFETGSWGGNVRQFNDFSEDLYKIVRREPLSIKLLQYIDIKDHLRKIEGFLNKKAAHFIKQKERIDDYFYKKKKERKNR